MTIENLLTPVGRIVWGHPGKSQTKTNQETNQPVIRDGQQVEQWVFGVAFPKHEFDQFIRPHMEQEALSGFPNGVPQKFSWKYKDGDTAVSSKNVPYRDMEGRAGCYILSISTEAYAPPLYKFNQQSGGYDQIDANAIKCGDYVRVGIDIKLNVPTNNYHTPGLYINPKGVELVGYGTEIISSSAPDPNDLFGGAPVAQLPPGASMTPVSSAPEGINPQMGQPMQQQPQQAAQPMQQAPAPAPQQMPPPATGFANGLAQQQPQQAAQPQAQPVQQQPMQQAPQQYAAPPQMGNAYAPTAAGQPNQAYAGNATTYPTSR